MRVVALLSTHNDERFIGASLEHLFREGVQAYLIDNCSTDRTLRMAEKYIGKGLIGITRPFINKAADPQALLRCKEQFVATLEADWFINLEPGEIALPPRSSGTLVEALSRADCAGYNAVNFIEFAFVPIRESPDHDHPDFQTTMRWYYTFYPGFPHKVCAWKRQAAPVDLTWSGGHRVWFKGLRLYPKSFLMRRYIFLSVAHAKRKFGHNSRPDSPRAAWQNWQPSRRDLESGALKLSPKSELRCYVSDDQLDASNPLSQHCWGDMQWMTEAATAGDAASR